MTTLYLLENEGFHSGKDEGNITKAAQRHDSNPARRSTWTSDRPALQAIISDLFPFLDIFYSA